MNIRKKTENLHLFERKEGRDRTAKLFWKYVRNMVCLLLAAIIVLVAVEPYEALAFICVDFVLMLFSGFYSLLSLRLRRMEERIEAGRTV